MTARVTRVGLQVAGFVDNGGRVVPYEPGTIFISLNRNNWLTNVSMDRSWQTDVTMSQTGIAEERWSLRSRPLLTQQAQLTGLEQNESADLLMHLARQAQHGNPVPIYPDRRRLTSAYSSGKRIFCDTTYRRFFLGQRIAIAPRDWGVVQVSGAYAPVEYATISAVDSTYIDIDEELTADYDVGSWIFPLFDAEPVLNIEYDRVTRSIINGTVTWVERSGESTLPSVLQSPHVAVPTFFEKDGFPILDMPMNGAIAGIVRREGKRYVSGRSNIVETYGELSRFGIQADFKCLNRPDWWRLLALFDTVRGRGGPFWFVNPQRLWDLVSADSQTQFTVKRTHYYHLFDPTLAATDNGRPPWLNWFCLIAGDGRAHITAITSVSEIDQDTWQITVTDNLPIGNIVRVTAAHLGRLEDDSLAENWYTFDIVTTQLTMIELLNEEDVTITNL